MVNSFFSKIILPGLFPVLLRQPSDLCHAPIIPIVSHSVPGRARILRFALLCPWRKCRKQSVCPNSVRPCLYILRRKLSVLLRCLAAECSGCLLLWLLGIGQDAPHGGRGLYVELVVYRVPIAVYVTVCRQLHAVVRIAVCGDHCLSLGCSADVFQDAYVQFLPCISDKGMNLK